MSKKIDADFIKKAARLIKGETLSKDELQKYYLHRKRKVHFRRLGINVENVNSQWSIDLAQIKDLANFNNQMEYLLCVIDVFSRYAFVVPLKRKSAKNVANKFESILIKEKQIPKKIQCDEGTEFQDIRKKLSKKYNFQVFHVYNRETKAAHVERFIGTLKTMIRRTLTVIGGFNYLKFLPLIVEKYNESPHSGIGNASPKDIYLNGKSLNRNKILKKILNTKPTKKILKVGDKVRLLRVKNNIFEKSSLQMWTKEVFVINKVFISDPVTYIVKDLNGEVIKGSFYFEELQKI